MTAPYYTDDSVQVFAGDCLDVLRGLPDNSVDSIVTDPPYGLEFMGKDWDSFKTYAGGNPNMKPQAASIAATEAGEWQPGRAYGSRQKNPRCRRCGKLLRGNGSCKCPEPIIDTRTAEGANQFQFWCETWAVECLRVLKPGGHLLAFGGTRTWHRLACAIEDAGFEIRDSIAWLYGSGFPKSLDVSKAIDKAAGAEREVVGLNQYAARRPGAGSSDVWDNQGPGLGGAASAIITAPATDDARTWQGWGTALKPSHEPVVVARKPLAGNVAANVLAHGTGALNVDGCRVEGPAWSRDSTAARGFKETKFLGSVGVGEAWSGEEVRAQSNPAGRWPPNVVLDQDAAAELDRQSGTSTSPGTYDRSTVVLNNVYGASNARPVQHGHGDSGGASRFFPVFKYEAKAPTSERPNYWRPACDCETIKPCEEASQPRATDDSRSAPGKSWNTSTSGNITTDGQSLTDTTYTIPTEINSTTPSGTYASSPNSNTSASTQAVNSEMEHGGSLAEFAETSSPSPTNTGTSALRDGPSTAGAVHAISLASSAISVCAGCGAPYRREAHPTTKPLDLIRWLIRLVTPPGGTCLDMFAGSGTTGEAAIVEGFHAILIEREPEYLPLIVARLTKPIAPTLFGGAA